MKFNPGVFERRGLFFVTQELFKRGSVPQTFKTTEQTTRVTNSDIQHLYPFRKPGLCYSACRGLFINKKLTFFK